MSAAAQEPAGRRPRAVVVGAGKVLDMHEPALRSGLFELVGVCDLDAEAAGARAEKLGCAAFTDHAAMLAATAPEVAVITTPHPAHAELTVAFLEAGCHVLVEKPMAVHVAEADRMIAAARRAGRLLAVNLQQRLRAEVRHARELIASGELGEVQRVDLLAAWPRTAAYYRSGAWRGTWSGEGGGVLMNQAPHNLDLLCHLVGAPRRLVGWTRTRFHDIETEDTVHGMLEWDGGALGSLHISTAEAGAKERLEIAGTRGMLTLGRNELTVATFDQDVSELLASRPETSAMPEVSDVQVEVEPGHGTHLAVYRNLREAIVSGAPLVADGLEGRMSLELINALILSSFGKAELGLPLDGERYASLLADLQAGRVMSG